MKRANETLQQPDRPSARKKPPVIRLLRAWAAQSIEASEPWVRVQRVIEKHRLSDRPAFDE